MKSTRKPSGKPPFKIAQDDVEPLGSNADMDRAKQCLGPFTGGKVGTSALEDEEYAEHTIYEIARSYRWHKTLSKTSPRSSSVKHSLDQIIEGTKMTFEALHRMNDHTRLMFEFCGRYEATKGLYAEANGAALPLSSFDGRSDKESPWLLQLQALNKLAFSQRRLIEFAAGTDKGGRSNLHNDLSVSVDFQLVEQSWHVFQLFKPGQATTRLKNNPFLDFVGYIYAYATKKDQTATGAPKLLKKIKEMLPHLVKLSSLEEQIRVANSMDDEIAPSDFNQESVARFAAQVENLIELAKEWERVKLALRQSTSKKRRVKPTEGVSSKLGA